MHGLLKLLRYWKNHPIASKDLRGTITRFIRWQLGTRLIKAPVLVPWIGKTQLVVEKGMTGATMNVYCGLHEFADMGFLLHFLRPGDRFADIGANVGSYTVLASGVVGADSICLEPIPDTFTKLERNIKLNGLEGKVTALCCGAGPAGSPPLKFIADRDTMNQVAPESYGGKTLDVPIQNLDTLLADRPASLWKVDVEGFELQVLSGAKVALQNPALKAVQLEDTSEAICAIMKQNGLALHQYDPFSRRLEPSNTGKPGHNWLWIRDAAVVQDRCQNGPHYTAAGVTF
jgi:FkbM family methyltransferase